MSYRYEASKTEGRAAAQLREKGWIVMPPPCPECRGTGRAPLIETHDNWTSYSTTSCPRGCIVSVTAISGTWGWASK